MQIWLEAKFPRIIFLIGDRETEGFMLSGKPDSSCIVRTWGPQKLPKMGGVRFSIKMGD